MFRTISPAQAGVPAEAIDAYLQYLDAHQLSTHSIILARGNDIFFEKYWVPFQADQVHRMYSVTKSFVSLAVGFLWQDGKIDLDRTLASYFPAETARITDPNVLAQTVRHTLMMSTAKSPIDWFRYRPADRVQCYFDNPAPSRVPGKTWEYDSTGSFVLCALVERLAGMPMLDYLRQKCLDKIGFSKAARMLICPGGHSWGDSALLCTPRDLLAAARFVLNGGAWDGQQLLSAEYVQAATGCQISTAGVRSSSYTQYGYGYQIWRNHRGSFSFNGMGCQFAICLPDKDLIFIYNGDNQGMDSAEDIFISGFFDLVVPVVSDTWAPPAVPEQDGFAYSCNFELMTAKGALHTPTQDAVNGVYFDLQPNPMGIRWLRLRFGEHGCALEYQNAQGVKMLGFAMGKNLLMPFPQTGYSDQVGSVSQPWHCYRSANSAAWVDENTLYLKTQIIDDYFGRLESYFTFENGVLTLRMEKCAEDFLNEYQGSATGTARR